VNIPEQNNLTITPSSPENSTTSHQSLKRSETVSVINDIFHVLDVFLSLFQKGKLNWMTKLYLLCNATISSFFVLFQSMHLFTDNFIFSDCLHDLLIDKVDQLSHQQRDRISKVFLAMLKDSDYRVRLSVSKTVTLLFRLPSTNHHNLYKDIRKELHSFLSGMSRERERERERLRPCLLISKSSSSNSSLFYF
jgi:hypothetical protein